MSSGRSGCSVSCCRWATLCEMSASRWWTHSPSTPIMANQQSGGNSRRRPSVLQWNTLSLRRRRADLAMHLLQSSYDVLALQEVGVAVDELRLPGYVGYQGATACTVESCTDTPCTTGGHPQGKPRVAIYVRRELQHAHIDVSGVMGGASSVVQCRCVCAVLTPRWPRYTSAHVDPGTPPCSSTWPRALAGTTSFAAISMLITPLGEAARAAPEERTW